MDEALNCTDEEINRAAKALKDGYLVAFPTETVYGLGADSCNEIAVGRVYSVKGRPIDHPLIVHISSIEQIDKFAVDIPEYAIKLATQFWPGPMTLILKKSHIAKNFITGGQTGIGIRIPNHPIALSLLKEFEKFGGLGIAAPSANKFMAVSTTSAKAVREDIGDKMDINDLILDGGQSSVGIESTIINCMDNNARILRDGAVTADQIKKLIGTLFNPDSNPSSRVSGNFKKHYSPKAKIILDVVPKDGQALIAMSQFKTPKNVIRLAAPVTEIEFGQVLYESFRLGDAMSLSEIVVYQPKGEGISLAIRDRLLKASYPSELIE